MLDLIPIILLPFIVTVFITPVIKKIAEHIGALDIPNERKIHNKPIPRLGGLAIYCGFLVGYILFGSQNAQMNSVLIASFIIILVGVVDDIKPIPARYKFLGQLLAALILVFYGNFVMHDISAFGIYINFNVFAYLITIFFILGSINCINLIDGLDGLAAGISSIFFLTIGIIAFIRGPLGLEYILTFIMLGSTLGFLIYNFNPAEIFMGDSGSMFLGLIISVIALIGFKNVTVTSLVVPVLMLAIPILDTLFAILRRFLKGESISKPDRFHIHHQFLNRNFNQKETVLIIYFIDALFAYASIVYVLKDNVQGYIIYGILFVLVAIFLLKTNVLYDKENSRIKFFHKKKVK